jgi:nitrous oxide reductase accessory protein NosL
MRVARIGTAIAAAGLALSACAGAAAGPPEIRYGRDVCVQCNMIISEVGHAAAYRLDDGTERLFDGVGEMLVYGSAHAELAAADAWVHDYLAEEWVRAVDAFFVPTESVASPMGHGIFAFSDRVRAEGFAVDVGGEVIDWATVLALPIVDGRIAHDHDPPPGDAAPATGRDAVGSSEMEGIEG